MQGHDAQFDAVCCKSEPTGWYRLPDFYCSEVYGSQGCLADEYAAALDYQVAGAADSKPDHILHEEMSHFTDVAESSDTLYWGAGEDVAEQHKGTRVESSLTI